MKNIGIYKITNKLTGKCYIGQSRNIDLRLKVHFNSDSYIGNSIKKYGSLNFTTEILKNCSIEELNDFEEFFVDYFNCVSPLGYNLRAGGIQTGIISEETRDKLKFKRTSEQKKQLSDSHIGLKHTDETKLKIGIALKDRVFSDETKLKMSNAQKGRKHSKETKEKLRIASMGNTNNSKKLTNKKN